MNKNSGFTLIELMIVMVILLSLLSISMLSVKTITNHWHKRSEKSRNMLVEYKNIDMLASVLHAVVPLEAKNKQGNTGFYFLGRENGFTAVTENGILNDGRLTVFRLLKEKQSDGRYSLFYEEASLNDYPLVYIEQKHNFNFRLLILKNLRTLEFSYFGWENLQQKVQSSVDNLIATAPAWHTSFDGMTKGQQPIKLMLNIDGHNWSVNTVDRSNFLMNRRPVTGDI